MFLRPAVPADLPQIVALERLPESRRYVGQWNEDHHARALAGRDARYYVHEDEHGQIQAYIILVGFEEGPQSIEFKRFVVAQTGRGLGRRLLAEILRLVFDDIGAHRFYLDVVEDNARARHLYKSFGFTEEGILRDATQRDGEWLSLVLMSLLEHEYRDRGRPPRTNESRIS
jgi:RimJ/RimL family protein N-acetyltransferase